MAKIKKLIEDNVIHYPATITDAVKNPNNGKTVTEELTELGSEVINSIYNFFCLFFINAKILLQLLI